MLQKVLMTATACGMLAACATAQEADVPGWLEKDFAELTSLFEGRWDNDRHVFFAEAAGMDTATLAPRQHIEITRVALAGDEDAKPGTVTFKAVRTVEGEAPTEIVHLFSIDADSQSIRQTLAVPAGLLPPEPMDCHVDWARSSGQFLGTARGEACDSVFSRPVDGGDLSVTLALSETEFWVQSARGNALIEARLRRARPFECWTAILRGAEHGDSGQGMNDWDFRRGVKLHDQGGVAELITEEETPRRIRLRLRDVDWPYGTNRPSLTMYVLEGDNDRAVAYTWTEAGADRIGINLRWLQASCTYAPGNDED
ncbi:MAG: hypothetical protein HRT82_14945 [Henriciella sp.]|nr:hypothetical protein [Henriciella sp.]